MNNAEPVVLYGSTSPNVVKVGIMLEELGVPYELRHVSVFASEQYQPEFLAMNPIGKIPVLVDPALGRPLFESGAIFFYLAERHGRFFPADGAARYEIMQWLMVQMAWVGPMLGQLTHFRIVLKRAPTLRRGPFRGGGEAGYQILDERLSMRRLDRGGCLFDRRHGGLSLDVLYGEAWLCARGTSRIGPLAR